MEPELPAHDRAPGRARLGGVPLLRATHRRPKGKAHRPLSRTRRHPPSQARRAGVRDPNGAENRVRGRRRRSRDRLVRPARFHPVTDIPAHWPDWYQDIVQARIDTITSRRDIALIERPECKRRWATDTWEKREKAALRTWLLDKCEHKSFWFHVLNDFEQPRTLTIGQLADELENQPDAKAILNTASLYAAHLGKPNLSLTQVLQDVIDAEHVPYLAAHRYKDTGLRKRAQWEDVWEQQREEDRTGERLNIPVPPKYTSADFLKQSYWSNRGKLDVAKERFVSYPDASPGSDPTLLLGWVEAGTSVIRPPLC